MDTVLLLARLVLAGVFTLSAVTKLMDLEGSRRAVAGFGVPERFALAGGIALPVAELVIAVLLLPTNTAWWAALAALLLLLGFIAGIAYNLREGRTPDCHCFGQLHSEPIGTRTIVRDGIFAAIAAVIVLFGWDDPGTSTVAWYGNLTTWEQVLTILAIVLVACVAAQSWVLFQMMRQNGRLLIRLDAIDSRLDGQESTSSTSVDSTSTSPAPATPLGLPEGTQAPAFQLQGIYGETQTLDALRAPGKPVLLIFSSPTCGPCNALMPEIGRWQRDYARHLTTAIIGSGEPAANRAKSAEHGLHNVLLQQQGEVSELYRASGTPSAVLVNADGTIGSHLSQGADAIRALANRIVEAAPPEIPTAAEAPAALDSTAEAVPASNGVHDVEEMELMSALSKETLSPAPPINLPDLDGKMISLSDFAGEPTVVLFWNPTCGFCQRMLDDLKAWEENPPQDAPKLLVVSTGTLEANRAQGLRSPLVIDDGFATGKAVGASGTPAAVLIDREGHIAGAVAVGAPRVFAMLNGEELVEETPGAPPIELTIGDPAPPIELPDLDGNMVSLTDVATVPTVVLFWSPGCVFCQRMVEDLKAWEEEPPENAPRLLVISRGDLDANRAAGLQAPILIDSEFGVGQSYGASGTPSAVLVDGEGKVASKLKVGAGNVLKLTGYVSKVCQECLDSCVQQGGGTACQTVCEMGGQC